MWNNVQNVKYWGDTKRFYQFLRLFCNSLRTLKLYEISTLPQSNNCKNEEESKEDLCAYLKEFTNLEKLKISSNAIIDHVFDFEIYRKLGLSSTRP